MAPVLKWLMLTGLFVLTTTTNLGANENAVSVLAISDKRAQQQERASTAATPSELCARALDELLDADDDDANDSTSSAQQQQHDALPPAFIWVSADERFSTPAGGDDDGAGGGGGGGRGRVRCAAVFVSKRDLLADAGCLRTLLRPTIKRRATFGSNNNWSGGDEHRTSHRRELPVRIELHERLPALTGFIDVPEESALAATSVSIPLITLPDDAASDDWGEAKSARLTHPCIFPVLKQRTPNVSRLAIDGVACWHQRRQRQNPQKQAIGARRGGKLLCRAVDIEALESPGVAAFGELDVSRDNVRQFNLSSPFVFQRRHDSVGRPLNVALQSVLFPAFFAASPSEPAAGEWSSFHFTEAACEALQNRTDGRVHCISALHTQNDAAADDDEKRLLLPDNFFPPSAASIFHHSVRRITTTTTKADAPPSPSSFSDAFIPVLFIGVILVLAAVIAAFMISNCRRQHYYDTI